MFLWLIHVLCAPLVPCSWQLPRTQKCFPHIFLVLSLGCGCSSSLFSPSAHTVPHCTPWCASPLSEDMRILVFPKYCHIPLQNGYTQLHFYQGCTFPPTLGTIYLSMACHVVVVSVTVTGHSLVDGHLSCFPSFRIRRSTAATIPQGHVSWFLSVSSTSPPHLPPLFLNPSS